MVTRREFLGGRFASLREMLSAAQDSSVAKVATATAASVSADANAAVTDEVATAAAVRPLAQIGPACSAQQNIVCRVCGDACPELAIRFSPRLGQAALPTVDPDKCTACGDCVAPCPQNAISIRP